MKNLKKIIYIGLTMVVGSSIISCSLEEDPKYSLNSKTIFNDETSAETSLNECYGKLASAQVYGQFLNEVTAANGVYWGKTVGDTERTVSYDSYQEYDRLSKLWQGFYKIIGESNYLIDGITKSNLNNDYKTHVLAHARFLRGFAYYKLANLFGKAIIINEPITSKNLHTPISSRDDVYNEALKDLSFAAENIKDAGQDETIMAGYATKQTAQAYLAKCYWLMACHAQADGKDAMDLFNKAKMYGDLVINSGKFQLQANYADLFKSHVGNSPESIFQVNFSTENGVRNRSSFDFSTAGYSQKGFANYKMDRAFYDFQKGSYPDDPRIESTYLTHWVDSRNQKNIYLYPLVFYVDWSTGKKVENIYDMSTDAPLLNNDRKNPEYDFNALPKKVQDYWNNTAKWDKNLNPLNKKMADPNQSPSQYDTRNMMIFRYADLLLLMADVENELGNKAKAIEYVNQVLTRARQSGANATYPMSLSNNLSKEELRDKIFFERMFEMAGETELFEDIRRRGTEFLKKVISIHNDNYSIIYRYNFEQAKDIKSGNFRTYLIKPKTLSERDFLRKNLVLPIPSSEINYNDKVTQNDQNFGY